MKPRAIYRRSWLALVALVIWCQTAAAEVPPPAAPVQGTLVIVGGGLPEAARQRFIELAGGKAAKLVCLAPDGVDSLIAAAALLQIRTRAEADDPDRLKPLTEATGVWLGGDNPVRLVETYRGTPVARELGRLLQRGGVIGCTSAVVSDLLIAGPGEQPGLGLLPGVIVALHVLKRDRVNRLSAALGRHPGYAGIGIDEQTAVVIQGRSVTAVGDSYVLLCQSAAPNRPASIQVLRGGERADWLALRRAALVRAGKPFPPEKPAVPNLPNGTLMIGGGGRLGDNLWKRFIALAGGPESLIVVVPTANDDPVPAEPAEAKALRKAGATNVKILHTRDRAEADRPEFAAALHDARGVWFTGGRQWRFVDAYEGTATERAFHAVLARGGVIGGSSAGASIQSEYMPRGDPLGNRKIIAEGYERGFGFLPGVAVDQHFFARKRTADMTELMAAYPQLLGLGIDEGTVAIVHGTVMEVAGRSKIAVYDRRKPAPKAGPDYEELPAGTHYDLAARQRK